MVPAVQGTYNGPQMSLLTQQAQKNPLASSWHAVHRDAGSAHELKSDVSKPNLQH